MIVPCPDCRDPLDVPPALAGRPVRCGACGATFTPPGPDPAEVGAPPPARGSGFGAAAGLLLLVVLVVGPCAGVFTWAVADWGYPAFRTTADPLGFWAADFPGEAEPFTRTTADNRTVHGVQFDRDFPPERYFVAHVDLPPVAGGAGADDALEEAATELTELVPFGMAESRRAEGNHDGHPCLDLLLDDPPAQWVVRSVVVDGAVARRLYVAGWHGPGKPDDYRVKRFFLGFRILKGN